jgi:hypothetical protein
MTKESLHAQMDIKPLFKVLRVAFPARDSFVIVTSRLGTGKSQNFFYNETHTAGTVPELFRKMLSPFKLRRKSEDAIPLNGACPAMLCN